MTDKVEFTNARNNTSGLKDGHAKKDHTGPAGQYKSARGEDRIDQEDIEDGHVRLE